MSRDKIPAGGRGKIEVSFDTSDRKGFYRKIVRVYTNDPEKPVLRITISADIFTE